MKRPSCGEILFLITIVVVLIFAGTISKCSAEVSFQPVGGAMLGIGLRGIDEGKTWNEFYFGTSIPGLSNDSTRGVYTVYRHTELNEYSKDGGDGAQIIAAWRSMYWPQGWWLANIGFIQDVAYQSDGFRATGHTFGMGYIHEVGRGYHLAVYFERIWRGACGYSTNLFFGLTIDAPFRLKVG